MPENFLDLPEGVKMWIVWIMWIIFRWRGICVGNMPFLVTKNDIKISTEKIKISTGKIPGERNFSVDIVEN